MSEYSNELWNQYTDDNENTLQVDLSQFIYNTCITLDTKRICEAGCNIGNNLSSLGFTFYGFLSATIINGLICSQNYNTLMKFDIYIFIFCGILIGVAGLFVSVSARTLESSIFAPIQYSQLFAGLIFGYLFFRDLPDFFEIIGSIIIILSGIFIIYKDTQSGIRPFTSKVSRVRDIFNRGH